MVMDQAPAMSLVVVNRLPVNVFCAVTATPGRGTLPLFTTPCIFPPATVISGCAVDATGAEEVLGGAGACAPTRTPPQTIPINIADTRALRRIHSPVLRARTHADGQGIGKVYEFV